MKLADSPQLENYQEGIQVEEIPSSPRKKKLQSLIIFLLLAVVVVAIFPYIPFGSLSLAKSGTLTGQVVNLDGDALHNVLVYIDQQWVSSYTDAKGIFTLDEVETGEHFLVIEAIPDIPEFFLVNIEQGIINDAGILTTNTR